MKHLWPVPIWFICLAILIKTILPGQPLGFFWLVVFFLSLFFGLPFCRKAEIPQDFNYQQKVWWDKYLNSSYYHKQLLLNEFVEKAIKTNQLKQAERFINAIIDYEPDNETAKSLLISIWSAEVFSNNNQHLNTKVNSYKIL